jgi:hypothetical protein
MQTIVFLATTGLGVTTVPVKTIVAVADIGATVGVPACEAVTTQFPDLRRFSVEPDIEQLSVDVVENVTAPPLDAVATSAKLLVATSTVAAGVNVIV